MKQQHVSDTPTSRGAVALLSLALLISVGGYVPDTMANPYMTVMPQRRKPPVVQKSSRTLPPPQPAKSNTITQPSSQKSGVTSPSTTVYTIPKKPTHPDFKIVDLLENRLFVEVPQDAERNPRQLQKGAPPESEQRETRFFVYKRPNKEELVLMAAEMFATMSPDFRTRAVEYWKKMYDVPFAIRDLPSSGNFQLYLVVPLQFKKHSSMVRAAYVVRNDKTVQFVALYASPPAMKNPAEAIAVSEKILRTLKPGPRSLHIQAGKRTLETGNPRKKIELQVPLNYHVVAQKAKDYQLYYINPLMALGNRGPSILVYVGKKPEPFFKREQEASQKLTMTHPSVRILGQSMTWYRWIKEPPKGLPRFTVKEIVFPLPGDSQLQIHILFSFTSQHAYLEPELTRIAASLKIVDETPQP